MEGVEADSIQQELEESRSQRSEHSQRCDRLAMELEQQLEASHQRQSLELRGLQQVPLPCESDSAWRACIGCA